MRVVGGVFGGMAIKTPKTGALRPTQDRVREALFNIVRGGIEGRAFLDLFAGTGAVGIEALSRGASSATFVERDGRHLASLSENLAELARRGCPAERWRTVRADAGRFLASCVGGAFGAVFADPPYAEADAEWCAATLRAAAGVVATGGFFIAETPASTVPPAAEGWELFRDRTYGKTRLSVWRLA